MNPVPIHGPAYKLIVDTLASINKYAPTEEDKNRLTIDTIINTLTVIEEQQAKAQIDSFPLLEEILLVSRLYIAGIGTLALSLHKDESSELLFPKNWISEDCVPNPNFILSHQLIQMANHALAVVNLCTSGLDNPARILCRTTAELAHQTLILFSDPNEFRHWMKGEDAETSTQAWYHLFAKDKIGKKLRELEAKICIDLSSLDLFEQERKNSNSYNSMAVHHSYVNSAAGSYSIPNLESEDLDCALFGRANAASINTLHDLAISLHYFCSMFLAMIFRLHEFQIEGQRDTSLLEALATIESAKNLLIHIESARA